MRKRPASKKVIQESRAKNQKRDDKGNSDSESDDDVTRNHDGE